MPPKIDLTGERFGRLVVQKEQPLRKNGQIVWECKCDCHATIEVTANNLRSGNTTACSCKRAEHLRSLSREHLKGNTHNKKHGYHKHPLYCITYSSMKQRCFNPKCPSYEYWGGRGITICDEWLGSNGVSNFIEWALTNGWKSGMVIHRKEGCKDYTPNNCIFLSKSDHSKIHHPKGAPFGFGAKGKALGSELAFQGVDVEVINIETGDPGEMSQVEADEVKRELLL